MKEIPMYMKEIGIIEVVLKISDEKNLSSQVDEILKDVILFDNSINGYRTIGKLKLSHVCELEELLEVELLKIPTDKEWKKIIRKQKLEQIKDNES